jgi:hypothetical protein
VGHPSSNAGVEVVEEPGADPERDRRDDAAAGGSPGASAPSGDAAAPSAAGSARTARIRTRIAGRFVALRAATIARDGGPGRVLRLAARAPAVSTAVLVLVLGTVFAGTFGVPPISPLFLVVLLCAPVYPWLRLEARAIAAWQAGSDAHGQPGAG